MTHDNFKTFLRHYDPAEISAGRLAKLHTKITNDIEKHSQQDEIYISTPPSKWCLTSCSRHFVASAIALLVLGFFLGQEIAPKSIAKINTTIQQNEEQFFAIANLCAPWQTAILEKKELQNGN